MPNRHPLLVRALVDQTPTHAERVFAAFAVTSMLVISAALILF